MTKYETGARVIARGLPGYPGTVRGEYMPGMYEVRLERGGIVVDGCELIPAEGITLTVYRNEVDCTGGGVTATADRVTVVGVLDPDGWIEPLPAGCQDAVASDAAPAVVLVASRLPDYSPTPHLVPVGLTPAYAPRDMVGPMFGGNRAGSTDSRWAALGLRFGAGRLDLVKVHDRMETVAKYMELGQ